MHRRCRPLAIWSILPIVGLLLLAGCDRRGPMRGVADGPPQIDPLPIPDPLPWPRIDEAEPGEVPLLFGDEALAGAICRDRGGKLAAGGTLFGHTRFDDADAAVLTAAPVALSGGSCQLVHSAAAGPLAAMIAAATAQDPPVGRAIFAISCHRSVDRQAALFCDPSRVAQRGYAGQARWIAPPGFSEHATGLSIDFGSRTQGECDLRPCFATTAAGRWLAAHARQFGFEMSFPAGNAQGVAYEPWHFRYVGTTETRAMFNGTAHRPDAAAR